MSIDNKPSVDKTEKTTPSDVVKVSETTETKSQEETTENADVVIETTETKSQEETTENVDVVIETTEDDSIEEENPLAGETQTILTHVFSGDVEGEVYTLDQLEKPSDEYSEDEYNQLMGMYENTLNEIEEKEIVTGRIISMMINML